VVGIFSKLLPDFRVRELNRQRIQHFRGEWIIIAIIFTAGAWLIQDRYVEFHLPLTTKLDLPKYAVKKVEGKTYDGVSKRYFTVLFDNGFGYHYDEEPTDEQIKELYFNRTELLTKTPALKYEKHLFYGVYTDIRRIQIYRAKIGRLLLGWGYPFYLAMMFVMYFLYSMFKK